METDCCNNPSACWEPCGDLGKDIRNAIVSPENYGVTRYDFNSMKGEWKIKRDHNNQIKEKHETKN